MSRSEEAISTTGFGEYLRREREMRGVSLEEISAATKISIRFLQAIENEELAKLPGGIFTRSFVRTYARYLGLDEDRVLADCQLAGKQKQDIDIRRITTNRTPQNGAGKRTRIIALLMALVLLAGGLALFRYSRRVREQQRSSPLVIPQPPATPEKTESAPVSTPAPQENNPALTATPASPTGAAPASGTPQGGAPSPGGKSNLAPQSTTSEGANALASSTNLVLQVAATERTWVAVDADGKTVLQKVLNPNEVENLKAHDAFDVTVGNAQGIVLTLNGETLKPLGKHGEVKSIHLTREDVKNPSPER